MMKIIKKKQKKKLWKLGKGIYKEKGKINNNKRILFVNIIN